MKEVPTKQQIQSACQVKGPWNIDPDDQYKLIMDTIQNRCSVPF